MSAPLSDNMHRILDRFNAAWNGPTPPRLEDFAPPADSPDYRPGMIELFKIDMERRLRRGEQPVLDDYCQRFPACADVAAACLEAARASVPRAAMGKETDDPQTPSTLESPPLPLPFGLPSWTIGEYEVLGRLRSGGMGDVYKARHRRLDKLVALKLLPASVQGSGEAVARFQREMKAIGALDHPNVVEAHDAGEQAGVVYLAMKLIDGVDLERLINQRGPLPIAEACELVRQAARGLHYLHERGLVHRDVKPSNLMRTPDGTVKVLDLGLARWRVETEAGHGLTGIGRVMGTPDFLAPEQIDNPMDADARADLYGLGGTLFYLLTGRAPFADHKSLIAKLDAHRFQPPPEVRTLRPEVPEELAALIQRLLAKTPEARPQTAAEAAAALAVFAAGAQREQTPTGNRETPAPPGSAEDQTKRRPALPLVFQVAARKRSYLLVAALGLTIALLAGLLAYWRFRREGRDDEITIRGKPLEEFVRDFVIANQEILPGDAFLEQYQLPPDDLEKLEQLLAKKRSRSDLTEREQWLCAVAANLLALNGRPLDDLTRWTGDAYLEKIAAQIDGEAKSIGKKLLDLKRESMVLLLAADTAYARRDWRTAIKGYERFRTLAEQNTSLKYAMGESTLIIAMKKEANAYLQRADRLVDEGKIKEAEADHTAVHRLWDRLSQIEIAGTDLDIRSDENKKPKEWMEKVKTGKAQSEVRGDGELWIHNENASFMYYRRVTVDKPNEICFRWRWKLVASSSLGFRDQNGFSANHPLTVILAFFDGQKLIALHYVWDQLEPKEKWWILRQPEDKFKIGDIVHETEYPHLVVASKSDPQGTWQTHTRDVAADYRKIYKHDPPPIRAVAIQTSYADGPPDLKRVAEGAVAGLQFLKKVDGRCRDPLPP